MSTGVEYEEQNLTKQDLQRYKRYYESSPVSSVAQFLIDKGIVKNIKQANTTLVSFSIALLISSGVIAWIYLFTPAPTENHFSPEVEERLNELQ